MALEDQQGFGNGRCAWDLVAVLHAIRPDNRDYYSISGEGDGRCNVDFFGANTWQDGDISGEEETDEDTLISAVFIEVVFL